ncbi:MAG: hypothetical protein HY917_03300 [Candidatus Diapherotrites archaeon]|nr:hypothetical protein [Candidatus Diapherotrites archaeon]
MGFPLRLILDTNIYGLIVEKDTELLVKAQTTSKVTICGFEVIRTELRDTPKQLRHKNRNLRNVLLSGYDNIVKKHSYRLSPLIEDLAGEYWKEYKGGISKKKMWNDFLIVACSSIHRLDIIVSEDNHSMISEPALAAYRRVNGKNELKEPAFHSLDQFAKLL